MVKVAVAGGTGGIGLHIVEGIIETGRHEVVVLSRRSSHPTLAKIGIRIIAVSYDDHAALAKALEGVHTVISTISGFEESTFTKPQLALLNAAVEAGVKRFVPSEFAARSAPDSLIDLYRLKWPVAEAAKKSGLEYTIYEVGIFMNYLASGTAGTGHLPPREFMFDIENCKATLPGDGSTYLVYTRAEDIGKFVAASLDLEKWPEFSQMRGDRKRLNEILQLAEQVRGQKFEVTYLPEAQLVETLNSRNQVSPEQRDEKSGTLDREKFSAQWWLEALRRNPTGFEGKNLNELFPQVKPVCIADFLQEWWGKNL
ncbi:uncharacterized protein PHACADRAFT_138514 [Phanerochaete carnosa HHB-10118-sp]|uniref:NmrA-like domain-containing protein n=1 Tax=Phanerochaete carnosa (strain HHB-10118-sp) TaxID=650164 RepID=K5WLL1_PHACS|nr:uncharacterized protein PHACADRAFT_138514 [Phanerochaete carnosa HHB-10118-sp]EKM60079.1 hypothetical protein PHACADRAFT_138514 [Phanerochaete carnosa HHB-10118-sp]